MDSYQSLFINFQKHFGAGPSRTYFSPGRVNLIGEYTDFNGGNVLPAAIDLGTYFAVRANGSRDINIFSEALRSQKSIPLDALAGHQAEGKWYDYIVGTLIEFHKLGLTGEGLDIYVANDLPQNSGLSSSASFTTGTAFLLNDLWICGLDRMALIHIAKNVENLFVGVQCGIMDQFTIAMGRAEHCVYLHCQSLDYELLPISMDGYEIVITDSRVPRKLVGSAYNQRREECDTALAILRQYRDLDYLCAASSADVEACDALKSVPEAHKRARHVVSENERVQQSAAALRRGDLKRFGELMLASHVSLRDDFEVSCPELDILVDAAMSVPGVLGSRMTGAGFGGCTVSLVATGSIPDFISATSQTYSSATPYKAQVIRCHVGDGVKRLDKQGVSGELKAG